MNFTEKRLFLYKLELDTQLNQCTYSNRDKKKFVTDKYSPYARIYKYKNKLNKALEKLHDSKHQTDKNIIKKNEK